MNKYSLNCKIKKEGVTRENIDLFSETYMIYTNDIAKLIDEFIFQKERRVLKYFYDLEKCNIKFNFDQYLIYKEFSNNNSKDSMSEAFHKAKYGEYWESILKKRIKSISTNLESFINRYGQEEGLKRYKQANKNKAPSLEKYINLYGKEDGTLRWNNWRESNRGNLSLERKIKIHGEEEGLRLYDEMRDIFKNKNYIEYYINLYGEVEGTNRYHERNRKNSESSKLNSIYVRDTPSYNEYRVKMEKEGKWTPLDQLTEREIYTKNVWKVTNEQNLRALKHFDKRGHQRHKDSYTLDHIISVHYGFTHNIPYDIIGDITNLQMIHHVENSSKRAKCYSVIDSCEHIRHLYKNRK